MDISLASILGTIAVGIAFAGTLVAALGLITHQDLSFDLIFRNGRRGFLALPLLLWTGPVLMIRAAGPLDDAPAVPRHLALLCYVVALAWGLACGHALLRAAGLVTEWLFLP